MHPERHKNIQPSPSLMMARSIPNVQQAQVLCIGTSPTELASLIADGISKHLENLNRFNPSSEKDAPKEIMTRKETAELFSVSLVTLHDWCNSGIIKPYKVGNRTYFKRSQLISVMDSSNNNECAL
jgi:hypothetical protein